MFAGLIAIAGSAWTGVVGLESLATLLPGDGSSTPAGVVTVTVLVIVPVVAAFTSPVTT